MSPKHPDQRHLDALKNPPASPNAPANLPLDTKHPRRDARNSDSVQSNKPAQFPKPHPSIPGNVPSGNPKDNAPGEPV